MKKTYITPALNAVKIESVSVMATSNIEKGKGPIEYEADILSNGFHGSLMEDDTEE